MTIEAERRCRVCRPDLQARTPGGQQVQEIVDVDLAVAVDVGRVTGVRAPGAQQNQEVVDVDAAVAVDVGRAARLRAAPREDLDAVSSDYRDYAGNLAPTIRFGSVKVASAG